MIIRKTLFLWAPLLFAFQSVCAIPSLDAVSFADQLNEKGFVEICDSEKKSVDFDFLYACFDEFIEFLQLNPSWEKKLYLAKERFIRSKEKDYYSTHFFGFYDESKKEERNQIAFYYSIHFHQFISSKYPEFHQILPIIRFFEACLHIQEPYGKVFKEAAIELGVEKIFSSKYDQPPLLLKVVKYYPSYAVKRPHYDGTAFSLFLDSTDSQSLLLSPYKDSFAVEDFSSPERNVLRGEEQNSMLLIPGAWLTEFSLYPTPHIVLKNGKTRYATIAFAMRPNYTPQNNKFSPLPLFKY